MASHARTASAATHRTAERPRGLVDPRRPRDASLMDPFWGRRAPQRSTARKAAGRVVARDLRRFRGATSPRGGHSGGGPEGLTARWGTRMGGFGELGEDSASRDHAELQSRLADVQEQFRATSDILKVLTSGASEQTRVFEAVVHNARRLLRADVAQIHLLEDDQYRIRWSSGHSRAYLDIVDRYPVLRDRGTLIGRVGMDRTAQQIKDVLADPDYSQLALQKLGGWRSIMGAPMLVEDEVVGVLTVWRNRVDPFEDRAGELLTTFAEQAALALRHVELVTTLEKRSAELGRKVEQLEALAEVGEAISSSLVADEVLATIVSHAVDLSDTDGGSLMEFDRSTGLFRVRTAYGTSEDVIEALRGAEIHIDRTWVGRATRTREVLQIPDLGVEPGPLDPHL